MKKYIIAIFTFIMIFCCVNVVYANQIGVEINGNVVSFIDEVPFIDRNNRVLVPLRAVADAMGIDVIWNEEAYQVALSKKYQKEYKIAIYDDLEKDIEAKRFNPLIERSKQPEFEENCHHLLEMMIAKASEIFEYLPIVENADIIRNILYNGVWSRYLIRHQQRKEKS